MAMGSNQDKGEGYQTKFWKDQSTANTSPALSMLLLWHHEDCGCARYRAGINETQEITSACGHLLIWTSQCLLTPRKTSLSCQGGPVTVMLSLVTTRPCSTKGDRLLLILSI